MCPKFFTNHSKLNQPVLYFAWNPYIQEEGNLVTAILKGLVEICGFNFFEAWHLVCGLDLDSSQQHSLIERFMIFSIVSVQLLQRVTISPASSA